jgi:hypothetical protein
LRDFSFGGKKNDLPELPTIHFLGWPKAKRIIWDPQALILALARLAFQFRQSSRLPNTTVFPLSPLGASSTIAIKHR